MKKGKEIVLEIMAENVSMQGLLAAGAHFGHRTRVWNPRMQPYIYTARSGIHIIDLQQTVRLLREARTFVEQVAGQGGTILFVGTKKQARETIAEEATRCGMPYITERWMGGMLTNFQTIELRRDYLLFLETRREHGEFDLFPKHERQQLQKEIEHLDALLGGVRAMRYLPSALFIVDTVKERSAVLEARRLDIPIVALADTNCSPDEIDYPIPANDDAIRTIRVLSAALADAIIAGRMTFLARKQEQVSPQTDVERE